MEQEYEANLLTKFHKLIIRLEHKKLVKSGVLRRDFASLDRKCYEAHEMLSHSDTPITEIERWLESMNKYINTDAQIRIKCLKGSFDQAKAEIWDELVEKFTVIETKKSIALCDDVRKRANWRELGSADIFMRFLESMYFFNIEFCQYFELCGRLIEKRRKASLRRVAKYVLAIAAESHYSPPPIVTKAVRSGYESPDEATIEIFKMMDIARKLN